MNDIDFIDDLPLFKTKKMKGVKAMKTVKAVKSTDINDMKLGAIVWHVVKRHKMLIVSTYAVAITTLYFVNGLPIAIHNMFGR